MLPQAEFGHASHRIRPVIENSYAVARVSDYLSCSIFRAMRGKLSTEKEQVPCCRRQKTAHRIHSVIENSYAIRTRRKDMITQPGGRLRYTQIAQITGYALGADGYVGGGRCTRSGLLLGGPPCCSGVEQHCGPSFCDRPKFVIMARGAQRGGQVGACCAPCPAACTSVIRL